MVENDHGGKAEGEGEGGGEGRGLGGEGTHFMHSRSHTKCDYRPSHPSYNAGTERGAMEEGLQRRDGGATMPGRRGRGAGGRVWFGLVWFVLDRSIFREISAE